jgi:hypothetical protein
MQIKSATTRNTNEQQDATTMLNIRPNGRKRFGIPLKRLLDEAGTGISRTNSCHDG